MIKVKKNILLAVVIALLISLVMIPAEVGAEESIYFYSPYPQGLVGVSKPEIGWTVFLGDNKVENISFRLNDKEIVVNYDKDRETFYGFPNDVLSNNNNVKAVLK